MRLAPSACLLALAFAIGPLSTDPAQAQGDFYKGKTVDIKIYSGAPHAFANPNNPWKGYREDAAKDAWARTLAFFAKHLKS